VTIGLTFHVFFATLAFGMSIAFELLMVGVTRTGRIDAVRAVFGAAARLRPIIGISFLVAILLGFYLAIAEHISLAAPWLLVSYACLIVAGACYGAIAQRRTRRMLALIAGSGDTMTDELAKAMSSATPLVAVIMALAMFLIIGAMIR
jgi:uncharacterized membrane protein